MQARDRHRRRDREEQRERSASVGDYHGLRSHQFGSYRYQDHSREYADQGSISSEERRPRNVAMDAMSYALHRVARSSFLRDTEMPPRPSKFTRPPFNSYDGKTDPVEHVSHYI